MYNDQTRDQLKARITTLRNHYDAGKITQEVLTSQVNNLEKEIDRRGSLTDMSDLEEALLLDTNIVRPERTGKHRK